MWMRRFLIKTAQPLHGIIVVRSIGSRDVLCNSLVLLICAAPVTDYDALRAQAKSMRTSKITEVRKLVSKLQKAQRAAEDALDLYGYTEHDADCTSVEPFA